jgi:catechol 2,3-dioxygenase-like lactoylglutathione lyase family enzyme
MKLTGQTPLLQVFDMNASERFYVDGLGFAVVARSPLVETPEGRFSHWMWLRSGDADLMLNTAFDSGERPPAPDAARACAHADVTIYFGCEDVDACFAHLRARGLACEAPRIAPYGMKQLHLRDPDGYGLCFQKAA